MKMNSRELAQITRAYIVFRAARERVPHGLTLEYYQGAIEKGIVHFFGVTLGPHGPVSDHEAPHLFREWMASRERA
jgi:hypothetical protein